MMADCMTKESASPDGLIHVVISSVLPKADEPSLFREWMKSKHTAFGSIFSDNMS